MVGIVPAVFYAAVALAADPVLKVSADPPSLLVGQTGTLRVTVVVEGGANVGLANGRTPTVPADDGLGLRYRGTSHRFQATGARIVSAFEYQYGVDALAEGVWTVGPSKVTLSDGSVLEAEPIAIEVKARAPGDEGPSTFDVEAGFRDLTAWEGELVLYHYTLVTTHPGVRAAWRLPTFDGLRQPQHGAPEERTYQVQDGAVTITTVDGTVPLIATGTGKVEIKPALATVETFLGGNGIGWRPRQEDRRATAPQTLEIRRLPPAPPNFSGVVGDVAFDARLERDRAAVGESVGLVVTVQSDGSLEGLSLPAYDAPGFSVYDDQQQVTGRLRDGRYEGAAAFRRVLVPVEAGEHELAPVELVTFSPHSGTYVTHRVELGTITATPGREGSGDIESFGADPEELPEETPVELAEPWGWGLAQTPRIGLAVPLLLAGASAPGFLTLFGQWLASVRRRWRTRRQANQGPPNPFKLLRGLSDDPAERLHAYDAAMRQALANHAGVSVGVLDRDVVVASLDESTATAVRGLIGRLDRARYGGGLAEDLDAEVRTVVALVEKA